MPANPSKSSSRGRKIWIFKSFVFISKFCSLWSDIMITDWWYSQWYTTTGVDQSPLGWGVLWKGAMWAEFQRYNAGMGRYQSTHCIEQDQDQAPSQRWPQYILDSRSSCQLVEPWRVVVRVLAVATPDWQESIYLTSEQSRNQISTVWEWRAANCQYWSRKQGGKTWGGATTSTTLTPQSPPRHTIIIT